MQLFDLSSGFLFNSLSPHITLTFYHTSWSFPPVSSNVSNSLGSIVTLNMSQNLVYHLENIVESRDLSDKCLTSTSTELALNWMWAFTLFWWERCVYHVCERSHRASWLLFDSFRGRYPTIYTFIMILFRCFASSSSGVIIVSVMLLEAHRASTLCDELFQSLLHFIARFNWTVCSEWRWASMFESLWDAYSATVVAREWKSLSIWATTCGILDFCLKWYTGCLF